MPLEKTLRGRESIDGSLYDTAHLVRQTVGLAALKGRSITIDNIRASPTQLGLDDALITLIEWLSRVCNASFEGMETESETLRFTPRTNSDSNKLEDESSWVTLSTLAGRGMFRFCKIQHKTPAPISFTLQAVLPFLVYRPSHPFRLTLEGGTHIPSAPSLSYVEHVLIPNLALIGLPQMRLTCKDEEKLCFSSTFKENGLGKATIEITPLDPGDTLPEFQTEFLLKSRGPVERLEVVVVGSELYRDRLFDSIANIIDSYDYIKDLECIEHSRSLESKGALCVLLVVVTKSGWHLGYEDIIETDKMIDDLGLSMISKRVVQGLMDELTNRDGTRRNGDFSGLDRWMEDQIVTFQSLAAVRRQSGETPRPFDTPAATESAKSKRKFSTLRRRFGSLGGSVDFSEVAYQPQEPYDRNNMGILINTSKNKENSNAADAKVGQNSAKLRKNKQKGGLSFGDVPDQSISSTTKGKDNNGIHDGSIAKVDLHASGKSKDDEDHNNDNDRGCPIASGGAEINDGVRDTENGQHHTSPANGTKENNGTKCTNNGEHSSSTAAKSGRNGDAQHDNQTPDIKNASNTSSRVRKPQGKAQQTQEAVTSATNYQSMARRAPTLQTRTTMFACDRILDVAFSDEGLCNGCERPVKLRAHNYAKPVDKLAFIRDMKFGGSVMG